tara:strand:+ start:95143 stop:95298 length:156 start_codon:yes stop_codon:yes gene_type:complete
MEFFSGSKKLTTNWGEMVVMEKNWEYWGVLALYKAKLGPASDINNFDLIPK